MEGGDAAGRRGSGGGDGGERGALQSRQGFFGGVAELFQRLGVGPRGNATRQRGGGGGPGRANQLQRRATQRGRLRNQGAPYPRDVVPRAGRPHPGAIETTPDSQLQFTIGGGALQLQIRHAGRTNRSLAFKIMRNTRRYRIPSYQGIIPPDTAVVVDIILEDDPPYDQQGQPGLASLDDEIILVQSVAVSDTLATRFRKKGQSRRDARALWDSAKSESSSQVFSKKLSVRHVGRGEDDAAGYRKVIGAEEREPRERGSATVREPNSVESNEGVPDDLRRDEGIVQQHEVGAHEEANAMDGVEFEGGQADPHEEQVALAEIREHERRRQGAQWLSNFQEFMLLEGLRGLTVSHGPGDDSQPQRTAAPEPMDVETEAEAEQPGELMGDDPSHPSNAAVTSGVLQAAPAPAAETSQRPSTATLTVSQPSQPPNPGQQVVNSSSLAVQLPVASVLNAAAATLVVRRDAPAPDRTTNAPHVLEVDGASPAGEQSNGAGSAPVPDRPAIGGDDAAPADDRLVDVGAAAMEGVNEGRREGDGDDDTVEPCDGCGNSVPPAELLQCSNCEAMSYCSKECQSRHWRIHHKHQCQQMAEQEDRAVAERLQQADDRDLAQLMESSGINFNELIGSPANRPMSALRSPSAPTKEKVPICFDVGSACHVTGLEHLLRQELLHCPICERRSANCVHCDDAPCTEFGCRGCLELRECDTCSKLCCENCLELATNGEYELVDMLVCRTCFDEIPLAGDFQTPCDMTNTVCLPHNHPGVTLRNILAVHSQWGHFARFQCRNAACEKASRGNPKDDFCNRCYNHFQRGNITFQPSPAFDEDRASIGVDRIVVAEGGTVRSLKDKYMYLTARDDRFHARVQVGAAQWATRNFAVPADAALARLLLTFVATGQLDSDTNFGRQSWKYYFATRERDVSVIQQASELDDGEESDLPSMQNAWTMIAEWMHNDIKRRAGFADDRDRLERIKLVLQCLQKPSNLQQLFVGDDFVAQGDGDGLWDLHKRFESLYRIFDENGHLRSLFRVNGRDTPSNRRLKLGLLIDTIRAAFDRDMARKSLDPNAPWAGREADSEQFLALLEHLSASIASGANSANAFFENWQEQILQELEAKREEACTRRATEDEAGDLHGLEEAVVAEMPLDEYLEHEHFSRYYEELHKKHIVLKQLLKESETYRLFVEAQNTRGCVEDLQPLKDIVLREFGFVWSEIATFSDEMYREGDSNSKKEFLGSAMRGIIWRIRKRCVFPGCSRGAANHSDPGARYAFHDDHEDMLMDPWDVSKLANPCDMTDDIPTMVEEIFDCTFQKCNMHHDQKTEAGYFIPASKLRNNLDYPNGTVHRNGRELAEDFDVVVFVLGLLAVGAYHSYLDTPISSDNLTAWTYCCFELDLHDAVDWEGERLETKGRSYAMNDVLMGALDKLSGKCANPACSEDFMREMPWGKNGHHWDHEGGKGVTPAHLRSYSVLNLLNELGRYCALTCAMCHGIKTRLNDLGFLGRVFVHP